MEARDSTRMAAGIDKGAEQWLLSLTIELIHERDAHHRFAADALVYNKADEATDDQRRHT